MTRRPRLLAMVRHDLRWAFSWPFSWLVGIGVNLVLSLLYLVLVPLTGSDKVDWAILVGTYFAVFVLADVTTTNVLGVDATQTRLRLDAGVPLLQVLVAKNLALLVIVGVPTMLATGLITAYLEPEHRVVLTLPGVLYPILTWLGVGNVISVLLPYEPRPLRVRWADRADLRTTAYWLGCLALPYVLCVAVDQTKVLPRLPGDSLGLPATDAAHGAEVTVLSFLVWGLFTALAMAVAAGARFGARWRVVEQLGR